MILEDLLEDLNSFGPFQILLTLLTILPKAAFAWSIVIPAFAGVVQDWWCIPDTLYQNETSKGDNSTYKMCNQVNVSTCQRIYEDSVVTVVSEWDLVCEKRLISKTITSIQMSGVMVGVILAGQIGDTFGRKKILFGSIGLHAVFALICAFSVSWEMYAVFRFLIGLTFGSFSGTYFPHPVEFIGNKWRPILAAFPAWTLGLFGLVLFAYLCHNWSYLHMAASLLSGVFLLGWFFVPESLRWLTVKGRVDEAEAVVDQIVKYNKRPKPVDTRARLELVAQEELAQAETHRKYTFLDTVRSWGMFKTTFCSSFIWFSCSVMYYGVTFGVSGLAGNIYLNMFLLTAVDLPAHLLLYWLTKTIGRKWTVLVFSLIAGVVMSATLGVHLGVNEPLKGTVVTVLALVGNLCQTGAWMVMFLLTNELYPTVIRTLGFGVSQTASRIGGIVAPLMLLMDEENIVIPFVVMGAMMLVSCVCILLLPETKDRPLQDILHLKRGGYVAAQKTQKNDDRPLQDLLELNKESDTIVNRDASSNDTYDNEETDAEIVILGDKQN